MTLESVSDSAKVTHENVSSQYLREGTNQCGQSARAIRKEIPTWLPVHMRSHPRRQGGSTDSALAMQLRIELRTGADGDKPFVGNYLRALKLVEEHRASTQRNVNPQLSMAVLACNLSDSL